MSATPSISYLDICDNTPNSIQTRMSSKSITIPSSVVEIADNSFENSTVENIIFMDDSQLKTIGQAAFKNCKFLKSIQIPPSVVKIADEAFFDSSLEKIVFTYDSQLKTIGKEVFRDCKFLKSITIPDSVTHIQTCAFLNSAIEKVLFGKNSQCTTIGQSAFEDCRFLKSIEIPSSVLTIEYGVFSNSGIQTLIFTDDSKLETIGEFVFSNCQALQSIKIPSSVVVIDYSAFSESAIEEVLFSDDSKLEILSDYMFEKCQSLKSITIPASILKIGEFTFSESGVEEIIFSDDCVSNLKTIGKHAFNQTKINKPIQIPVSIVEIEEYAFAQSTLPKIIFAEESKLLMIHLRTFQNCHFLKSIKIPDSIVTIGQKAFSESGLEEVLFSVNSQLRIIDKEAFFKCKSLKSFIFPKTLNKISSSAFSFCNLPKSIKFLSASVELLDDPFFKSGVEEITFENSKKKTKIIKKKQMTKKSQITEKHDHLLQLSKQGDIFLCKQNAQLDEINFSNTKNTNTKNKDKDKDIDNALPIAITTKNVELIKSLIKNNISTYQNCTSLDIKNCFSDDDIIESVLFEDAFVFWYSICSFVPKKLYRLISKLIEMLKSKEYINDWVEIFKIFDLNTPFQCIIQGNSVDFYQFLLDYNFIKLADLEASTIKKYFSLASQFGNVEVLKKSLKVLPQKNITFQFEDFLAHTPQDKLISMIEFTLPYIVKNKGDPFGLVAKGRYYRYYDYEKIDPHMLMFPETVLSYLAYIQAFDAFKYIIGNVSNTQYTPSHLVACSLFRGYNDTKEAGKVDKSSFLDFFDYILQDDIRPYVLGEDKEWVGKSIFTCIEYGSSEMCMKLFSYGFDKNDIYIDVISGESYDKFIRYSLLSYACKYQSLEVVQFLIDSGVDVDGLLPNHTDSSHVLNNDGDEIEREIERESEYKNNDIDDDDDDEKEEEDNVETQTDVTNPRNFLFENIDSVENAWFEPYFNPYRINKNQDVEIYDDDPFDPSTKDPLERLLQRIPSMYLTLMNFTPLAVAIYVQDLDLVRLLLKSGVDPNTKTLIGIPHLFVLGMRRVFKVSRNYLRATPEMKYSDTRILSNMEDKTKDEEEKKGEKMKMEDKSKEEDVSASPSTSVGANPPDIKFAIFQELVNHGADLFHDHVDKRKFANNFNIYNLSAHLNYSLNLLKYLQMIPELGDKIKKYYIDSFRSSIVKYHHARELSLFSADTVDYMFHNGYVSLDTYRKDKKFMQAIESTITHYQDDMKLVLKKYGFSFPNHTKKKK